MANEHDDKKAPAPKVAEPKLPAPTQDELNASHEALVKKSEAAGHRDDPDVAAARALLERLPKKEEKNASHKG